jgi:hypothetical protein
VTAINAIVAIAQPIISKNAPFQPPLSTMRPTPQPLTMLLR